MTFTCDACLGSTYKIIFKSRGQPTNSYLITDRSYGQHHQMVRCESCSLIQVYPKLDLDENLSRYESFTDPDYEIESQYRIQNCNRILAHVSKFVSPPGHLLDVGCATGILLTQANLLGWTPEGIEPSRWAAKIGMSKGLNINVGTLSTVSIKKRFDVITCIDVIEHVDSPTELLIQMRKLLKPNGVLCIVTPNISAPIARFLGEGWWHVRPDHIFYFTPKTLINVATKVGLSPILQTTYPWTFSLNYWISRLGLPRVPLGSLPITLDLLDSQLLIFKQLHVK